MGGILWCLPATNLAYLQQAGDVRIVTQNIFERLTHAGSEVCGVHLDGMLTAEVLLRAENTAKILIGIDVEDTVVRSPYCCCPLHCREAVAYRAASDHCIYQTAPITIRYHTGCIAVLNSTLAPEVVYQTCTRVKTAAC